jgi:hypothetical protein
MTTASLPQRLTRPLRLRLGAMIGIEMQRRYEQGMWFERRLARVDQRPQIALIAPPAVYALLPPSACLHTLRPYVVDECQEQDAYVDRELVYRWRYNWFTRCKRFALRVGVPDHQVILQGTRIEVYDAIPEWYRPCGTCVHIARKEQR